MWLWSVLWCASGLLVSGTINLGFLSQQRQYVPTSQMNCYEYSKLDIQRFGRSMTHDEEWRSRRSSAKNRKPGLLYTSYPLNIMNANQMMSRRLDKLFPKEDELVKEHAKLVQDINSLKQVVFIAPLDDTRDVQYDDSIFHEIIEISSTSTARPTTKATRPVKTGFPIIFVGGESSRHVVRSPPLNFPKSINLVGTTMTPLLKHPYPFVTQGSDRPLRVCMSSLPPYPATTKRPGLWERLINAILPKQRYV